MPVVALALALASGCTIFGVDIGEPQTPGDAPEVTRAEVTKNTDGDTLHVMIDDVDETVRLIGIDSPEIGQRLEPFGEEAAAFTAGEAAPGTEVWIETDAQVRDEYGRLLAYVWLERPSSGDREDVRLRMLNALVVSSGYAYANTYPPNVRYQGVLRDLQAEANADSRGLWAEHEPERQ